MSYRLVEDLQKKACPKVAVSQACRVLEVSRSGYYALIAQPAGLQVLRRGALCHVKAV